MKLSKIKKIQHDYWILKELHGNSISERNRLEILSKDHGIDKCDVEFAVGYDLEKRPPLKKQKYGIIMGRFQPFHFGHQHIINEIILDGRKPIVILGDDNGKDPKKNPLSVSQRMTLIEQVFPREYIIFSVKDNPDSWTDWFNELTDKLKTVAEDFDDVALYYHNKECDRYDYFDCNGREYFNEFYTVIFEDAGIQLREVEFVDRSDIKIDANARNIRDDFEAYKHLMDGRNYWTLKNWGW